MKSILIVGSGSYIGNALAPMLRKNYKVTQFDILGIQPEVIDFGGYDTVIMVAGVEPTHKADKHPEDYYKINRDLTHHTAIAAKAYGVKHFIVMSSLDVYGTKEAHVTSESTAAPETDYAKSKYEADQKVSALQDDNFAVSVVRLPVVYGKKKTGVLTDVCQKLFGNFRRRTERIHIDSVCSLINSIIVEGVSGVIVAAE